MLLESERPLEGPTSMAAICADTSAAGDELVALVALVSGVFAIMLCLRFQCAATDLFGLSLLL